MDEKTKVMNCIGMGTRHNAAVGCVALSQVEVKFFVSVSQDCCLKLWDLPENLTYTGKSFFFLLLNS
jgi:U3 small nucleolar RNA-associated protein 13